MPNFAIAEHRQMGAPRCFQTGQLATAFRVLALVIVALGGFMNSEPPFCGVGPPKLLFLGGFQTLPPAPDLVMPRSLVFQLGDRDYSFQMIKVDRSKLYGYKELKVLDENDTRCELATLAGDGRTLVGRGGTGLGWLDVDGGWREKDQLKPVDTDGEEVIPVPSSFSAPIKLFDTATAEEYLECNVRLVYSLETENNDIQDIMDELNRGTIFTFPYSYRGGLEADVAFILLNDDDELMMVVGDRTKIEYIGLAAQSAVVNEEAEESTSDDDFMDFDMI